MKYYFFPLTYEEAQDPTKKGYAYAKANQSRWVQFDEMHEYLTVGHVMYQDKFVYQDKVYDMERNYLIKDTNVILFICPENISACESKKF